MTQRQPFFRLCRPRSLLPSAVSLELFQTAPRRCSPRAFFCYRRIVLNAASTSSEVFLSCYRTARSATRQPPKVCRFQCWPVRVMSYRARLRRPLTMTRLGKGGSYAPPVASPLNSCRTPQGCGKRKKGRPRLAPLAVIIRSCLAFPVPQIPPGHGHPRRPCYGLAIHYRRCQHRGCLLWRDGQREDFRLRHSPKRLATLAAPLKWVFLCCAPRRTRPSSGAKWAKATGARR